MYKCTLPVPYYKLNKIFVKGHKSKCPLSDSILSWVGICILYYVGFHGMYSVLCDIARFSRASEVT